MRVVIGGGHGNIARRLTPRRSEEQIVQAVRAGARGDQIGTAR